jgi:hypothetical protein
MKVHRMETIWELDVSKELPAENRLSLTLKHDVARPADPAAIDNGSVVFEEVS